ncbi:MAG: hypothetical protein WCH21_02220 [Bacteroidota bacterium]
MNKEILKQLQGAQNLGQLLDIIIANYEVEKTNISPIVKGTIISGLQMAVNMTKCKERK